MVHDSVTGIVGDFDRDDDLTRTAERIVAAFRAPAKWRALARGSRARHRDAFNWDAHAHTLLTSMRAMLAEAA
jgi:hypothetical protein